MPAIRLVEVSKSYADLRALDRVSLEIGAGEIRAVVGENGAGKSTLMGVMCGAVKPDDGEIWVGGRLMSSYSARTAVQRGISYVQQHFSLIPTLTVAQNVELFLHGSGRKVKSKDATRIIASICEEHRLQVDPDRLVANLTVGDQQRAELVKALAAEPRLLVLDEPTALLSPDEAADLERILHRLAARGTSIIYVSHKLDEVMRLADRITVMRRGAAVWSGARRESSAGSLGALMVGSQEGEASERSAAAAAQAPHPGRGVPVLEAIAVSVAGSKGAECARDVTLSVRGGEIVGLAGVEGSGHLELIEAIAGVRKTTRGRVLLEGRDVTRLAVARRRKLGLAFVPSDRRGVGLFEGLSLAENLTLGRLGREPVSRFGLLTRRGNERYAREVVDRYHVVAPGVGAPMRGLSGGNQQKLLLARELEAGAPLLALASPTWGLDFAARAGIHALLGRARERGTAILLASVDLEELLSLSDRILVFAGGEIMGEVSPSAGLTTELGLMLGGSSVLQGQR